MSNNNFNLFYRKYYEADSVSDIMSINNDICKSQLVQIDKQIIDNEDQFFLYTLYPGLLIGSGYNHDYKSSSAEQKNEAYKIGFHFDFTTGMPVIPGSSIKGMLRSCFPQRSVKSKKHLKNQDSKEDFIKSIIKDELGICCSVDIDALENEIFNGVYDSKPIPLYERDIFFDAVPVSVNNSKHQLFDDDYITPHIKADKSYEESMLLDPEPLKFLKVSPLVCYRFEFKLNKSRVCNELTAEKKRILFKSLITTFGLGAKTNVGYGQFIDCENLFKDFVELSDVNTGDEIECEIGEIVFRDNDNKYQVYLKPKIKNYPEFLRSLNKPFPSIRVEKHLISDIENSLILICKVKSIADDKRVMFDTKYKLK